ncbi:phage tail protein [Orbus wheelerorum]|uniref:phage tail protein n=1 Tax=Orbus wheelerorum TaxID=3074111 RepID=UPI00370D7799
MSLINQLTVFLKANLPEVIFRGQKFTPFTDSMELERVFKVVTNNQLQGGIIRYEAVFEFEDWPFRQINPQSLFLLVNVWVEELPESDHYEIIENPTLDVDLIDEELADITVSIKITENLYMVEDDKGDIPFKNKRYRIDNPVIWYNPESIEVITKNGH